MADPSLQAPKRWWNKMEKSIKKGNPDYDEETVRKTIGNIWANLSVEKKKEIRGREGKTYGPAPAPESLSKAGTFLSLVEKASSWKVYINGKDSGIIETNYEWASQYWNEKARRTGKKIKLVKED